jgi:hypothetical protein
LRLKKLGNKQKKEKVVQGALTSTVSRLGKCTQNRKMVWHFYGKTKTAIISSKNQFRPQFWAQIVAGAETDLYSLFLGPGDLFFGKVMRKTRFRKFSAGIHHTIIKKKSTFVP